ncbi:MAG: ribosome maturation factor RimM [Gammaproteobacteria bacterium]|nr:ribosome maturation factor RimM [Gammaproteobacteria bacterium]
MKKIIVGKFGKTHGVKGWLHVRSHTDPITNIIDYLPWQIKKHGAWEEISITDTKILPNSVIAKIADIDNPEDAKKFTNYEIAIEPEQLPKLEANEYYWSNLEGLTVINTQGKTLGTIDHLIATGTHDVIVIKNSKEILIPYINDVVKTIDLEKQTILVEWNENAL